MRLAVRPHALHAPTPVHVCDSQRHDSHSPKLSAQPGASLLSPAVGADLLNTPSVYLTLLLTTFFSFRLQKRARHSDISSTLNSSTLACAVTLHFLLPLTLQRPSSSLQNSLTQVGDLDHRVIFKSPLATNTNKYHLVFISDLPQTPPILYLPVKYPPTFLSDVLQHLYPHVSDHDAGAYHRRPRQERRPCLEPEARRR